MLKTLGNSADTTGKESWVIKWIIIPCWASVLPHIAYWVYSAFI